MYKIISKEILSELVVKLEIEAPRIAKKRKAGHFIIVKQGAEGERIPLTISHANPETGTISVIIQKLGVSSHKIADLHAGEFITDIVGPLGKATHIKSYGTVLCAGGGVGIAPLLPIAQAFKQAGNKVISVLAARNKELIILEDEMRACSDQVIIMTDDGSYGNKGLVTDGMEQAIASSNIDFCMVIGPGIMMKFASLVTKKYAIKTYASLNTIMVDGTGMCGACRVTIDGETKFVCVDGPEFNAHKINFDEMLMRLGAFKQEEQKAYHDFLQNK